MTDSVNSAVFWDVRGRMLVSAARFSHGPPGCSAVQQAVVLRRSENPLHVVLRLGERDVIDELVLFEIGPLGAPAIHPVLACVVGRERRGRIATVATEQIRE